MVFQHSFALTIYSQVIGHMYKVQQDLRALDLEAVRIYFLSNISLLEYELVLLKHNGQKCFSIIIII